MQNNSPVATPVNVIGFDPSITDPLKVEVVQPTIELFGLDTIPVTIWSKYPIKGQTLGGAAPAAVDGVVLVGIPCELRTLTGWCSDPDESAQYYVQLHETNVVPLAPLAIPLVVFPLKGGLTQFSLTQELEFDPGMTLVLSTTPNVFTAPAGQFLWYQATHGIAAF